MVAVAAGRSRRRGWLAPAIVTGSACHPLDVATEFFNRRTGKGLKAVFTRMVVKYGVRVHKGEVVLGSVFHLDNHSGFDEQRFSRSSGFGCGGHGFSPGLCCRALTLTILSISAGKGFCQQRCYPSPGIYREFFLAVSLYRV